MVLLVATVLVAARVAPREAFGQTQGVWGTKPALRTSGRWFVDPTGRVVVLRGVNLSGRAKVPPFRPLDDLSALDRVQAFGFNVVRLVFIWEAFEPMPGVYDRAYLEQIRSVAEAAWARGLYVVVDVHQDGFSRYVSRGSGDGFPAWAVSPRARASTPNNGPSAALWPILMATDPATHRSFADFHSNACGVRDRYLAMLRLLASALADIPGVIGYDPMNEPWGDEVRALAPLYDDAARVIRQVDPSAILFLEGHVTTNSGLQTHLPRPTFGNVAYAPHYYQPLTVVAKRWFGQTASMRHAFARMEATADRWCAPLFLGEFGAPAEAARSLGYVSAIYDGLDRGFHSGTQWNFTPQWTPVDRDGWNAEDFNVIDPSGQPRANFPVRPSPRAIAGTPAGFLYVEYTAPTDAASFELAWSHEPARGATEVFVPKALFPPGSVLAASASGVQVVHDVVRQRLIISTSNDGLIRLRMTAPRRPGR
ncbi:MAG: cellulase family glycosylhydrolase [Isosphaeraceae bacterium]